MDKAQSPVAIVGTKRFSCYTLLDADQDQDDRKRSRNQDAGNKWTWKPISTNKSRIGEFVDNNGTCKGFVTPAIITPTVGGCVPHLTCDIWEGDASFKKAYISVVFDDLKNFLSWDKCAHHCLNQCEDDVFIITSFRTSSHTRPDRNIEARDDVLTECVEDMETIFKPDLMIRPGDAVPYSAGSNRNSLAVDRSAAWASRFRSKSSLGYVVGRDIKSVQAWFRKNSPSTDEGGLFIDIGSSSDLKDLLALHDSRLLRVYAGGCAGPAEVLQLISTGVDMVETTYPQFVAKSGYFSVFPVNDQLTSEWGSLSKVDARSFDFMTDKRPLVHGCVCFACKNHSRAYIRHLAETREMLGETLLYAHNLTMMIQLVATARRHIMNGTFDGWYGRWQAVMSQ